MQTINKQESNVNQETIKNWFDRFISSISVDKMMMETGTAPDRVTEFYNSVILDDYHTLSKQARDTSTRFFVVKVVEYYLSKLKEFNVKPQKLAFDFSDAKILVWAQISDEDEATEDALILSEAKANAEYSETGFYVSSTIVEESDNLILPPHYHEVKIHGGLQGAF